MTVKYDMEALKSDMKEAALDCAKAKHRFREAQRILSAVRHQENHSGEIPGERVRCVGVVNAARSDVGAAALTMTKLCVFKAHLRGRAHLSAGSSLLPLAKGWITELAPQYVLKEPQTVDKPAA